MNKAIIYPHKENEVAICVQAPTNKLSLEEFVKIMVPANTPWKIIDVSEIPSDRTFRNAWEWEA